MGRYLGRRRAVGCGRRPGLRGRFHGSSAHRIVSAYRVVVLPARDGPWRRRGGWRDGQGRRAVLHVRRNQGAGRSGGRVKAGHHFRDGGLTRRRERRRRRLFFHLLPLAWRRRRGRGLIFGLARLPRLLLLCLAVVDGIAVGADLLLLPLAFGLLGRAGRRGAVGGAVRRAAICGNGSDVCVDGKSRSGICYTFTSGRRCVG